MQKKAKQIVKLSDDTLKEIKEVFQKYDPDGKQYISRTACRNIL